MSKDIIKDVNYYKELFKAFYNKRFKNVKEVKQLAESLGYKTFCDTYQDVTIYKKCITITQREKKDFLYFKKDDFLLGNPYFGFASNVCKKNQIGKNIAREIYRTLGKKYPKLNKDYIISADFTSRTYDIKRFNADWKIVLEDVLNILEVNNDK